MKKRHVSITIIAFVLLAGLTACPRQRQPRPAPQTPSALLEIKVIPPDAAIIVDGRLAGNAWDVQLIKFTIGPHIIEVRKEGYEPFRGKVNGGATTYLEVELKKIE